MIHQIKDIFDLLVALLMMNSQGTSKVQIIHPAGINDSYYDIWLKPVLQLNGQSHSGCKKSKGFAKILNLLAIHQVAVKIFTFAMEVMFLVALVCLLAC